MGGSRALIITSAGWIASVSIWVSCYSDPRKASCADGDRRGSVCGASRPNWVRRTVPLRVPKSAFVRVSCAICGGRIDAKTRRI
jgi:hypothetical protein